MWLHDQLRSLQLKTSGNIEDIFILITIGVLIFFVQKNLPYISEKDSEVLPKKCLKITDSGFVMKKIFQDENWVMEMHIDETGDDTLFCYKKDPPRETLHLIGDGDHPQHSEPSQKVSGVDLETALNGGSPPENDSITRLISDNQVDVAPYFDELPPSQDFGSLPGLAKKLLHYQTEFNRLSGNYGNIFSKMSHQISIKTGIVKRPDQKEIVDGLLYVLQEIGSRSKGLAQRTYHDLDEMQSYVRAIRMKCKELTRNKTGLEQQYSGLKANYDHLLTTHKDTTWDQEIIYEARDMKDELETDMAKTLLTLNRHNEAIAEYHFQEQELIRIKRVVMTVTSEVERIQERSSRMGGLIQSVKKTLFNVKDQQTLIEVMNYASGLVSDQTANLFSGIGRTIDCLSETYANSPVKGFYKDIFSQNQQFMSSIYHAKKEWDAIPNSIGKTLSREKGL